MSYGVYAAACTIQGEIKDSSGTEVALGTAVNCSLFRNNGNNENYTTTTGAGFPPVLAYYHQYKCSMNCDVIGSDTVTVAGYNSTHVGENSTTMSASSTSMNVTVDDRPVPDTAPTSTPSLPTDAQNYNTYTQPYNVTFECNATDTHQLASIKLYLTDETNSSFALNQTYSASGTSNSTTWTIELLGGDYTWNCLATDNASQTDWGTNRTLSVNYTAPTYNVNVTKTLLSADPHAVGDIVQFRIDVENNGSFNITDLYVLDMFSASELAYNATNYSNGLTIISGEVEWDLELNVGETLSILINFTALDEVNTTNVASVINDSDYDFGNATAVAELELPVYEANVTKTLESSGPHLVGTTAQFLINATNIGDYAISGFTLYDDYDHTYLDYTAANDTSGITVTQASGEIEWTLSLAVNESRLILVNFTTLQVGTTFNEIHVENSSEDEFAYDNVSVNIPANVDPTNNVSTIGYLNVLEDSFNNSINLSLYTSDTEDAIADLNWSCSSNESYVTASASNTTKFLNVSASSNFYGYANITCIVYDTNSGSATDSFLANVSNVNDQPFIPDISNNDTAITRGQQVQARCYAEDVDNDNSGLIVNISYRLETGSWVYVPGATYSSGDDWWYVNITAGTSDAWISTVDIACNVSDGSLVNWFSELDNITVTNNAPVLDSLSGLSPYSMDEDSTNASTNLSAYAVDVEDADAALNYTCTDNETDFTVSVDNSSKLINLTASNNFYGSVLVNCTLYDTDGATDIQTFTVAVSNVNDAPTVDLSSLDNFALAEDTTNSSIDVSATVTDIDTSSFTWTCTSNNTGNLSVSVASTTMTISASNNFTGYINVSCNVSDGEYIANDTFIVNVTAVNDAPVISSVAISPATAYTNSTLNCTGTYSDVELDAESGSTFKWFKGGTQISGQTTQTLASTFFNKTHTMICEYTPNDGTTAGDAVNSSGVVISNLAPYINHTVTNHETNENESFSYDFNCTDVDEDSITYALNDTSVFTINSSTGVVSGTPTFNQEGEYYYNITCTDGAATASTLWNVNVTDVPILSFSVSKTLVTSAVALPEAIVSFNITISHVQDGNLTNVTVNDTYDTGYLSYNASSIIPASAVDDGNIEFGDITSQLGNVTENGEISFIVNFTALSNLTTQTNNTASVYVLSTTGLNATTSDIASVGIQNASISVTKSASPSSGAVGDGTQFTINVTSVGALNLTNVTLTDYLPDGLTYVTSNTTPDSSAGGVIVWTLGNFTSGQTQLITVNATIDADARSVCAGFSCTNTANVTSLMEGTSTEIPDTGTAAVAITNTAPSVLSVAISPTTAYTNTTLNCTGTFNDTDTGDSESGSSWRWYNQTGLITGVTSQTIAGNNFSKGDTIICEYTPSDSYDNGTAANSSGITISNLAPTLDHDLSALTVNQNETTTYDINCSDLDEDDSVDTLTYSLDDTTYFNINASTGLVNWTTNLSHRGLYQFVVTCSDGTASATDTLNITVTDVFAPTVTITSPSGSYTDSYNMDLNVTTSEITTCNYSIDGASFTAFGTNATSHYTTFSVVTNGAHNVTVNCTDQAGLTAQENVSFTINDTTAPNVTATGPSGTKSSRSQTLTVTTDETALCRYSTTDLAYANMTNNFTTTNPTTHTQSLTSLSNGAKTYYVRCADLLNNTMNASETITFTISVTTTTTTTGGGGGGSSSRVIVGYGEDGADVGGFAVSFEDDVGEIAKGRKGEIYTFQYGSKSYELSIDSVYLDSVKVTIAGVQSQIYKDAPIDFDVNGDGENDFTVLLKNIVMNYAQIKMFKLQAAPPEEPTVDAEPTTEDVTTTPSDGATTQQEEKTPEEIIAEAEEEGGNAILWVFAAIVLLVVAGVLIYLGFGKGGLGGSSSKPPTQPSKPGQPDMLQQMKSEFNRDAAVVQQTVAKETDTAWHAFKDVVIRPIKGMFKKATTPKNNFKARMKPGNFP
ncbi:DUF11 domain-containing protein [Candidatus Woesearchaeota archaeon]|nr:DUF11 domain-containing protein [Candidatus Woesearchaeota archaeon]